LQYDLENHLLDDVPVAVRRDMWLQIDGAGPHYAVPVRRWLNENYENRWSSRGSATPWPARSPDLNPIDFFYGAVSNTLSRMISLSLKLKNVVKLFCLCLT
jgi:hypothetical protein